MSKKFTAYHEAGHAVAAWHFGYPLEGVSIVPGEDFGGISQSQTPTFHMNPDYDDAPEIEEAIRNQVVICYAGRAAQQLFSPRSWRHYHGQGDLETSVEIASYLVPPEQQEALHAQLLQEARTLTKELWGAVEKVAEVLLVEKTLSGEQTTRLIEEATGKVQVSRSKLFDYRDPAQQNPFDSVEDVF